MVYPGHDFEIRASAIRSVLKARRELTATFSWGDWKRFSI